MNKNKTNMILDRLYSLLGISKDVDFCDKYGVKCNTLSNWKTRDRVPYELIEEISQKEGLSLDYILFGKNMDKNTQNDNNAATIAVPKLSVTASAGYGNNIEGIEQFDTGEVIRIDRALFKTPPPKDIGIIKVEGYSMVPMLLPDSWVIFEKVEGFTTDGIYVINWRNNLMAKLIQLTPNGNIKIISANKDYESWEIDPDDQSVFHIIGKVIRVIM